LEVPNTLDHSQAPQGDEKWSADETVSSVERYLATERPNLMFVHIGEPDYAGHKFSWMSTFYGSAVRKSDRAVARVLAAADRAYGAGNYTVIVTADHGGHGWGHGSNDVRDVTIPWITWGKGVRRGVDLGDGIRTMDTAVTALWLLGLDGLGVGKSVQTAFAPQPGRVLAANAD
ncbi:MAG: alkaline phosphatase family protein, partial [Gemmatimonadetes bacterium]|nr:alkaline phosphatase family protein [Gemmatimonadota bacterium]